MARARSSSGSSSGYSSGAAKSAGWAIDSSSNFAGTVNCKFTEKAVYMRLEKLGLVIITTAPKWNMRVYNEINKSCINMPYDFWKTRFIVGTQHKRLTSQPELDPVAAHKTKLIQGCPAVEYIIKRKMPDGSLTDVSELWLAKSIVGPAQLKQLFHVVLNTPEDFRGVPLTISTHQNGQMVPILEAYRIKRTTFPKEQFQPLSGYKEVKDELALMLDESEQKDVADSLLGPLPKTNSEAQTKMRH